MKVIIAGIWMVVFVVCVNAETFVLKYRNGEVEVRTESGDVQKISVNPDKVSEFKTGCDVPMVVKDGGFLGKDRVVQSIFEGTRLAFYVKDGYPKVDVKSNKVKGWRSIKDENGDNLRAAIVSGFSYTTVIGPEVHSKSEKEIITEVRTEPKEGVNSKDR